jgi:7-cyano-7-deazaguanine synthase
MPDQEKAVVLLSGGIDSATTMAIAVSEGLEVYSLSFDYGQRHVFELEAARKISQFLHAKKHLITTLDLRSIGGSALTSEIDVPKRDRDLNDEKGIPITYVPARNTIFLSYALAWAEVLNATRIYIGVTAVDYSGYPDCRPEYIAAFQKMANLATKAAVEGKGEISIKTPLIHLTKAEIILKGSELGLDYSMSHSCYDPMPAGEACGQCDSCILRKKGFREAGIVDPARYA